MVKKIKYYVPVINKWDYQTRIYKNNPKIKWEGLVHERIQGVEYYTYLPEVEHWSLYHPKTIEKQEKQNNFYNTI